MEPVVRFSPQLFPKKRTFATFAGKLSPPPPKKNTPPSCLPPSLSHSFDNKLLTASISAHLLLTDFCGADVAEQSSRGPRRSRARGALSEARMPRCSQTTSTGRQPKSGSAGSVLFCLRKRHHVLHSKDPMNAHPGDIDRCSGRF